MSKGNSELVCTGGTRGLRSEQSHLVPIEEEGGLIAVYQSQVEFFFFFFAVIHHTPLWHARERIFLAQFHSLLIAPLLNEREALQAHLQSSCVARDAKKQLGRRALKSILQT